MNAHAEVRALLSKMRDRVAYLTKRPVDPDVENLTHLIETITASYMVPSVPNEWHGMKLTKNWRRVLDLLAQKPGHIFSKDAIMSAIYYDKSCDVGHEIVDVYVCKVRTELRRVAAPVWIETIWGLGYKLVNVPAREGASRLQPCGPGGRFGNQNARKYPKPVAS